jgi:hypothetical protein
MSDRVDEDVIIGRVVKREKASASASLASEGRKIREKGE